METGKLFNALKIDRLNQTELKTFAKQIGIPLKELDFYNKNNILPSHKILKRINEKAGISTLRIKLKMGIIDDQILNFLAANSNWIEDNIAVNVAIDESQISKPVFSTQLGQLYQGDCISLLKSTPDESFDLIFADPPFNLDKKYLSNINDNLPSNEYLSWCRKWLEECIRTLKPGGSLFLWNLPKWNAELSSFLNARLTFKNWIANDIKFSLPIQGKLYPAHYSLLYYCKGEKPSTFHPDRLPMEVCRSCYNEIKDYGGYKNKMNPAGINISDVWTDIPPVRHNKYKKRKEANELSLKLLDRIIEMSSNPGDVIFDPFGGSGTTYIAAELKQRKWVGIEIGPIESIIERFNNIQDEYIYIETMRKGYNRLFKEEIKNKRKQKGIWTEESFHSNIK